MAGAIDYACPAGYNFNSNGEVGVTERHVLETEILGEAVRLSSDVSEEHLRKVAACIDEKARDIRRVKRGLPVSAPLFRLLVNVNLADELVAARDNLAKSRLKTAALGKALAKANREIMRYEKLHEKKD